MTPAEHRAEAIELVRRNDDLGVAKAQVHATLALSPAAAPARKLPNPGRRVDVLDVELNYFAVTSSPAGSVVLEHPATEWSTLLDNPEAVRKLADILTAHADRMETTR